MRIYNTASKHVEEFKPLKKDMVKMYVCGPTVYNFPHLGNLRTYLNADFLRRSLEYLGYKVEEVVNITDVEDKIIRDSQKEGLNPENKSDLKKFTLPFEKAFFEDLALLNIEKAEYTPHATDEKVIKKMIEIIIGLLNKKIAYRADDGVYFSVANWKKYGVLVNLDTKSLKEGARIDSDEYDKEDIRDFALWKAPKTGEPSWETPFGPGRPGWHIECSAMSQLLLGETIDIHAGAVDLIFPHHENEIAQSEAFTGKKFVNYWFHGEHLLIEGERMAKSSGNFYTLSEATEKFKVEPLAFRMLSLMAHYREKLNFTEKGIGDAQAALVGLKDFVSRIGARGDSGEDVEGVINKTKEDFRAALEDDLNTPKALAAVFTMIREVNKLDGLSKKEAELVKAFILEVDSVLGLRLSEVTRATAPVNINLLVKEREVARKKGDFGKADELRKKIEEQGWGIEDTPDGPLAYIK